MCTQLIHRVTNVHKKVNRVIIDIIPIWVNKAPSIAQAWNQILDSTALALHSTVNNQVYSWDGNRLGILFPSSEWRVFERWSVIPDPQWGQESEILV